MLLIIVLSPASTFHGRFAADQRLLNLGSRHNFRAISPLIPSAWGVEIHLQCLAFELPRSSLGVAPRSSDSRRQCPAFPPSAKTDAQRRERSLRRTTSAVRTPTREIASLLPAEPKSPRGRCRKRCPP